jgi:hypothetical protein
MQYYQPENRDFLGKALTEAGHPQLAKQISKLPRGKRKR